MHLHNDYLREKQVRPPRTAEQYAHSQWMADIILHLRDDLILRDPLLAAQMPQAKDIKRWVLACYYPALADLEWPQAVFSLLQRLRVKSGINRTDRKVFATNALNQLRQSLGYQSTHH